MSTETTKLEEVKRNDAITHNPPVNHTKLALSTAVLVLGLVVEALKENTDLIATIFPHFKNLGSVIAALGAILLLVQRIGNATQQAKGPGAIKPQ